MTVKSTAHCASSVEYGMSRLLRVLARKSSADGVVFREIESAIHLQANVIDAVSVACWREALERGWIAVGQPSKISSEAGARRKAVITSKGRTQLRLLLSKPATTTPPQNADASLTAKPQLNPRECPVAWLSTRRGKDGTPLINAHQLAAAERLRSDFWFAGLSPRVTTNWAEPSTQPSYAAPDSMRDHTVAAGERVRRALNAVGPEMASLLVDVCCHLQGLEKIEAMQRWPQRSARIVLGVALTQLARHYGIITPQRQTASRIEHWGAEGYRPQATRTDQGSS